jgi:hypothetical protein
MLRDRVTCFSGGDERENCSAGKLSCSAGSRWRNGGGTGCVLGYGNAFPVLRESSRV